MVLSLHFGTTGSGCYTVTSRGIYSLRRDPFEATVRHITEPHVIDPFMLLEHLLRY